MSEKSSFAFQPLHAFLLIAAIAVLLALWFWPESKPEPVPEPIAISEPPVQAPSIIEPEVATPEPLPEPEPEPVTPAPKPIPLPSLDQSDPDVKAALTQANWNAISSFVTDEYIVRKAVRAVVAAGNGEWVNQHLPLKPPSTPFAVTGDKDNLQIDPANFQRYTPYVDAVVAIDAKTAVALYKQYYPLLQEAYEELGVKDGDFNTSLLKAIENLRSAPAYAQATLIHPSVMYKYKSPTLEGLPEIQKLALRIGPDNQLRLKAWLAELQAALENQQ